MKDRLGMEIEDIQGKSIAEKAGLLPGDVLMTINDYPVRDVIDVMFDSEEPELKIVVRRNKEKININIDNVSCQACDRHALLGIVPAPFKIRTCRNNCAFCFVSQLPKGLRKPLYIKDEDYRMSFLYGNYITMTNLSDDDRKRIVEQRLSPLYISVHCTDREIRNRLLGNPKAGDILKEIKFLADNKIMMHSQIVLCPGYNDGRILQKTMNDLYRFYPYVMSIAVVPVGLTSHRRKAMKPVEKEDAVKAIEMINKIQSRFKRKHGEHIVYAADEMYIKAGMDFPSLKDYDEMPQVENGVGMVALFMHQAKKVKIQPKTEIKEQKTIGKRFITFTGTSFFQYLQRFIERVKKSGVEIEVVEVENNFFGKSVTVTGLLTGRDVMKTLSSYVKKNDVLLIPDVVMREGDEVFLDDVSRHDVEDVLGVKAKIIESTPRGLLDAMLSDV
ncbi:MAG: DUF512 domain-containing protein [Thermodesulfovibrionales bacterium]|nr:DUF512 domain-containing protein [Thermodesulfovibrionales bacterium]